MDATPFGIQALAILRSQTENSTILIYSQLQIPNANPIYFAKLHAFQQPFLELHHWPNIDNVLVGEARSSSSALETRLTMNGQQYTLIADPDNNSFGLEGFGQGELRWIEGYHPRNMSLELVDQTGQPLAGLKAVHCNYPRMRLELHV